MPTIVVTALGGIQQTAIAEAFRAAGWTVRGTRRSPAPGVAAANLETGEGLAAAFAGADVVAFTLPQAHQPGVTTRMATQVAKAAAEAGVGRIVLNTAGRIAEDSGLPVFRAMAAARDAVTSGSVPSVVLEPTVFMDNLTAPWSIGSLLGGTLAYPAPEDTRVSWLSHRSLAEAVVAAASLDVAGRRFRIGGPQALTGADLAAPLAARLGRPVRYQAIPVEAFRDALNRAMGAPAGDRIAELYAHLAAHPAFLSDGTADMARLGVASEPFAAFVARTPWTVAA